jgi:hypothetical protein
MNLSFFHLLVSAHFYSALDKKLKKLDEIGFSITLCSFQGAHPEITLQGLEPSSTFASSAAMPVAEMNRCKYLHGLISAASPYSTCQPFTNACHSSAFRAVRTFFSFVPARI